MSISDVFFKFEGRLPRKTYWLASIAVSLTGFALVAIISAVNTGSAFPKAVWERTQEGAEVWRPIWLTMWLVIGWPTSAIAIKRLNDRGLPSWIWWPFLLATIGFNLLSDEALSRSEVMPFFIAYVIFGTYIGFHLGFLRGVPGPTAHGPDPLPADYTGGDYNFLSLMFAVEGRISRQKWWFGIAICAAVFLSAATIIVSAELLLLQRHPELADKIVKPDWLGTPEGQAFLAELMPYVILPYIAMTVALWSSIALGVKRLHDRGLSSWLILVPLAPLLLVMALPYFAQDEAQMQRVLSVFVVLSLASFLWSILQFGILKGIPGPNAHGPDPLAGK